MFVDIKGYEGLYQINQQGVVRSLDRRFQNSNGFNCFTKGKEIKPYISIKGYLNVRIRKDTVVKTYGIHKLLAINFIENNNNLKYVDHINGNKLDNRLGNLQWITNSDNSIKGVYIDGKANKIKSILQYDLKGNFISEHISIVKAQNLFLKGSKCLSNCLNNRTKSAYGYLWRYKDEIHQPGQPLLLTEQPRVVALF